MTTIKQNIMAGFIGGLFILACITLMGTTFTYTYDNATPVGTDAPSTLDDQDRNTKLAVQERADVDHYWEYTGTQVSDAATGEHRKISFHSQIADPTNAADKGWLYMKDASGNTELFWQDELGNVKQLTTDGEINVESADLLGRLANNTYFTAIDNAGTGTVDLIKANASDVAVLPDGSELATSGAPTADADIANKKYVDDQVTTSGYGALTTVDSGSDTFVKAHAYLAQQDGIVTARVLTDGNDKFIKGWNGNTDDPTGAGGIEQDVHQDDQTAMIINVTFPVASGRYWEVTTDSGNSATILWQPTQSSGGAPIDQD